MRALAWQAPGRQRIVDADAPSPGVGEVLVAPALVGICGSDLTAHKGLMGTERPGAIRGHEFGGTVVGSTDPALPTGTRVAVNPAIQCGRCPGCVAGRPTSCEAVSIVGVHRPGGFAELVAVPADRLHPIPDSLDWIAAATAEPLANAVHMVDLAASGRALGRVLVIGAGSIGEHIVAMSGPADEIVAVDPRAERRSVAQRAGAHRTLDSVEGLPAAGFDTVFDVVGSAGTRRAAIAACANGGRVVLVGLNENETAVPWHQVVRRELSLVGAQAFGPSDYAAAVAALIAAPGLAPEPVRLRPLDEGPALLDAMAAGDGFGGKTFLVVAP